MRCLRQFFIYREGQGLEDSRGPSLCLEDAGEKVMDVPSCVVTGCGTQEDNTDVVDINWTSSNFLSKSRFSTNKSADVFEPPALRSTTLSSTSTTLRLPPSWPAGSNPIRVKFPFSNITKIENEIIKV